MLRPAYSAACAVGLASLPIMMPEARAQQEPVQLPGLVIESEPAPPTKKPKPSSSVPGPPAQAVVEPAAAPVVVTPSRTEEPVANVASAITVIGRAEIERAGGAGATVADILKGSPGLNIAQSGGPGGETNVRIRGADGDQTLVMIDGVRINDPASTGSEFDFAVFSLANVERIEILRGPQSGLYGSDAIGGVINIITRKGEGPPQVFAEIEGGSYKTFSQRAGVSGANGPLSYSFGASNFRTSGFSRFDGGHENDATEKQAFNGRVDYEVAPNFSVGARLGLYTLDADLDSTQRDTPDYTERTLIDGAVTSRLDLLDGAMRNTLTLYANQADRLFFGCDNAACTSNTTSRFKGQRVGIELQSDMEVRGHDRITFGGRLEELSAESNDVSGTTSTVSPRYDVTEIHKAAFAIYTFNPVRAFTFSAAGRVDDFDTGELIGTYRFAAAYRIGDTGTKLRASYGTGAKAPTIQQRFDDTTLFGFLPVRGNPDLEIEKSRGFDVGIDQSLFDGAMDVSVTYFHNDIKDLIAYDAAKETFVNVDAAETQGVEVAAELRPLDWLRLGGSYTYLDAIDANTGRQLRRRPEHVAKGTVAIEPFAGAQIAATVVYQSQHFNLDFDPERPDRDRQIVDGFTRLDLTGDLEINSNATLFFRAENLTDTDYQEVYSFGTAGRSAYAGLRLTF